MPCMLYVTSLMSPRFHVFLPILNRALACCDGSRIRADDLFFFLKIVQYDAYINMYILIFINPTRIPSLYKPLQMLDLYEIDDITTDVFHCLRTRYTA